MTTYQHTQIGTAILYPLITAAVLGIALAFLSPIMRVALVVVIPLLLVAWVFSKLTVTIDERSLRAAFGPGFVYKQVPLDQIESCAPVRIKWWEGWGIHLSRFGWLYNVSGWDAVSIRLRGGKQLAIGTDQPRELADAIRRSASVM
jgi:hypothetical protein